MNNQIIYGTHAVQALLSAKPSTVLELWVLTARHASLIELATRAGITVQSVERRTLDELTAQALHQGIVARIRGEAAWSEVDLPALLTGATQPLIVILDGVQDPHNLGACLRSANAAGALAVLAPKDNACGLTPVVRKVACGAAELTPFIMVSNLARSLKWLQQQGVWIYGLAGDAEQSIYTADLRGAVGLVLGAEGKGLRRLTRECCDVLVQIPLLGGVSSLNVSVACGVALFETRRQQGAA